MGITPAGVRHSFDYVDGVLYWRHSPARRVKAGDIAGFYSHRAGMHIINLRGKGTTRPRCVWAWHFGAWPDGRLRHLDGNSRNDRIENLAPQRDLLKASPQLSNLPRAKSCNRARSLTPSYFGDSMGGKNCSNSKRVGERPRSLAFAKPEFHIVKRGHDHAR